MELNFLGNEGRFYSYGNHNSAFFITDENDFVLIDCPAQNFRKLMQCVEENTYNNIYVYITHTHVDHINGLGMFINYMYIDHMKKITVIAPSTSVAHDIKTLLKIEGVENHMYTLTVTYDFITSIVTKDHPDIAQKAFAFSVPTNHVQTLGGKCFGYVFEINGKKVIYTGDTNTLEPFIPFITKDAELYVDTSVLLNFKSSAHLWLNDILPILKDIVSKGTDVYLMHTDDSVVARNLIYNIPGIELAEKFNF